jgi:hypothetical protein
LLIEESPIRNPQCKDRKDSRALKNRLSSHSGPLTRRSAGRRPPVDACFGRHARELARACTVPLTTQAIHAAHPLIHLRQHGRDLLALAGAFVDWQIRIRAELP